MYGCAATSCPSGVNALLWTSKGRPVEKWLERLDLAPRSKSSIRGLLNILWDFSMWCDYVPVQRNPMQLVAVRNASKRTHKPQFECGGIPDVR